MRNMCISPKGIAFIRDSNFETKSGRRFGPDSGERRRHRVKREPIATTKVEILTSTSPASAKIVLYLGVILEEN